MKTLLTSGCTNQRGAGHSHQINLALLHHLCRPENDVWMKASFGTLNDEGTNSKILGECYCLSTAPSLSGTNSC
ncbi:hypothetical protein FWZ06_07935 [Escherichia coli]|nr:hypothetical protein [Escherichia coli]EFN6055982.1 hypothetical protein [Escherichia coli]